MRLRQNYRGVLPLLVLLAGCQGDDPVAPNDIFGTLSAGLETADVAFFFTPGDSVDADWQQRFHERTASVLGVRLPAKLQYFKYTGRAQMQSLVGRSTNGFAEPESFKVHSIFPRDGHEAIHVYTALVGRPSDFFNEGVAVALNSDPEAAALDPLWQGSPVHAHTRQLIADGRFVSLEAFVTTGDFRGVDEFVAYGEAGSFVLFLIEEFGLDRLLRFFRMSGRDDSRDSIEGAMRAVWQLSLEEAEERWLEVVNGDRGSR